jgi:CPA2 family monovalent cation:H+ antiporter-2
MGNSVLLPDVLIILLAAVAVVSAFRRLRGSAVLGYLIAGALIGPHGLDLLENAGATAVVAQLGVVFLLFAIGLELAVDRLLSLRRYVFGLGAYQVVATAALFWIALRWVGVDSAGALILATGFSLSSTAIVLQMLIERREIASSPGRVGFAVLLFQDLAVVPLLALVPLLGRPGADVLSALGSALVKAILALGLIVIVGRLALRPILRTIVRTRTPELFTGIVLLLVLGLGWLTEQMGLSMALGAFLGGLLVAETEYRHQVEGDIQPFRGILIALFFMTVGMAIDLSLLANRGLLIVGLLSALLLVKALVLFLLGRAFQLPSAIALAVGLMLAQGGEFGFVLFAVARDNRVLSEEIGQIAALVLALSMVATPALLMASRAVLRRFEQVDGLPSPLVDTARELNDHVLIAGFGRVGQTLGLLLESSLTPYLALDLDQERVALGRRDGLPVFFGDACRLEVLRAAAVERARVVVITLDEPSAANRAVHVVRQVRPEIPILARARDLTECERLTAAGATSVVPELVEGSLQLGAVLLGTLGESAEEVTELLERFRRETYSRLTEVTPAAGDW